MGVWQPIVMTIACSLMSGHGQVTRLLIKARSGHGFSFGGQNLDRNRDKVHFKVSIIAVFYLTITMLLFFSCGDWIL